MSKYLEKIEINGDFLSKNIIYPINLVNIDSIKTCEMFDLEKDIEIKEFSNNIKAINSSPSISYIEFFLFESRTKEVPNYDVQVPKFNIESPNVDFLDEKLKPSFLDIEYICNYAVDCFKRDVFCGKDVFHLDYSNLFDVEFVNEVTVPSDELIPRDYLSLDECYNEEAFECLSDNVLVSRKGKSEINSNESKLFPFIMCNNNFNLKINERFCNSFITNLYKDHKNVDCELSDEICLIYRNFYPDKVVKALKNYKTIIMLVTEDSSDIYRYYLVPNIILRQISSLDDISEYISLFSKT